MPKKKLKKKSKKKPQKKQKKQQKEDKNELPEVDKELYEIQISDLNTKLQRLKHQCSDLEKENIKMKDNLNQLNEDRGDVIAYLSRILKSKTEDIIQLQEQVTTIQQSREFENSAFSEMLNNKETELIKLQEQLTTEINLLNGKLNVLDEFRIQKDELMRKFQMQEEAQRQQELRHQETLHDIEKNFILKKLRMKREVEEQLIKLSEDFQTIMQSKIDETTKVTIAENNTYKSELVKLMDTCKELIKENKMLKSRERTLKTKCALLKEELDESIKQHICKGKELKKVLAENETLKTELSVIDVTTYNEKIQTLTNSLEEYKVNLCRQISINEELKQKISLYQQRENVLNENLKIALDRIRSVENIIRCASTSIKEILLAEKHEKDINHGCRTVFVSSLLEILNAAGAENHDETFQFKLL